LLIFHLSRKIQHFYITEEQKKEKIVMESFVQQYSNFMSLDDK